MIYIKEAHAKDEWALGNIVSIEQHKSIHERLAVAHNFVEDYNFKFPTYVDSMANTFNTVYNIWPERYFIFKGHSIASYCEPTNEFGFDRIALRKQLYNMLNIESIPPIPADAMPIYNTNPILK